MDIFLVLIVLVAGLVLALRLAPDARRGGRKRKFLQRDSLLRQRRRRDR